MARSLVVTMFLSAGLCCAIPVPAEVFAVPISDKVIRGRIELSEGQVAHFSVREGSMLTVRNEESGYWYGFVPEMAQGGRQVKFTPFEITPQNIGSERIDQLIGLEFESLFGEVSEFTPARESFAFVVEGIGRLKLNKIDQTSPRSAQPRDLQKIFGASGGGLCCVSCGVITVCGGSVTMSCGSCSGGRPSV